MKKVAISSREPKCKPISTLDGHPGWSRRQSTPSGSLHVLSQPLLSNTRSCKRNTSPRASSRRSLAPPADAWQIIWLFMPLRHQTLILLQTVACLTSPASLLRQCQRQEACARLELVQQLFLLSFPSALTPWPLNPHKLLLQPTQGVPADPHPNISLPLTPAFFQSDHTEQSSPPPHHVNHSPLLSQLLSFLPVASPMHLTTTAPPESSSLPCFFFWTRIENEKRKDKHTQRTNNKNLQEMSADIQQTIRRLTGNTEHVTE